MSGVFWELRILQGLYTSNNSEISILGGLSAWDEMGDFGMYFLVQWKQWKRVIVKCSVSVKLGVYTKISFLLLLPFRKTQVFHNEITIICLIFIEKET